MSGAGSNGGAGRVRIAAEDLGHLAALQAIGRGASGTNRLAWTPELAQAEAWFAEQAASTGRRVERDAAGNLWAVPDAPAPWWGVGSHLDSVRDGGAFDGALGVAAAFAVARRCEAPLTVIAFADEEGARFNTPTFGSRAMVGALDVADALAREDDAGVSLRAALAAWGLAPDLLLDAGAGLARLRGFLELHIDQGTELADAGAPVGVVARVAARQRVRVTLEGTADHAGTTPLASRRDSLAAAAELILAALGAGPRDETLLRTATRIVAEPNAATTIASRTIVWLDCRAATDGPLAGWLADVETAAERIAAARNVEVEVRRESLSPACEFAPELVRALNAAAPAGTPQTVCFAGHDAAILARKIPAGMVLVRNPTGISHARAEQVSLEDCAIGTETIARALEELG